MKLLIDTNVVLDVLCAREGLVEAASLIWKRCELGLDQGYLSALSIPNIVYILRKELTPAKTYQVIEQLMLIFYIVDLRATDLLKAAVEQSKDYEDQLQIIAAQRIKADCIVTRNVRDFQDSPVAVITPNQLIENIKCKLNITLNET